MTSRHGRGATPTVDDPERSTPRHQSSTGGRHGEGPGRQPFGPGFGSSDDDGTPPAGTPVRVPTPSISPETPPLPSTALPDVPVRPSSPVRRTPAPVRAPARWPWLLLAVVALVAGVVIGRATAPSVATPAAAPAAPVASAPPSAPSPAPRPLITLPGVSGRNGGVVAEQLRKLGLTKVQFASGDAGKTVNDPARWTAVKVQPGAGAQVTADAPVVVTLTQEN